MSKNIPRKKIYAMVISYKSSPVLEDLFKRINKDNFDKIYFFDDNSPDGSAEEAKKYDWIVIKNEKPSVTFEDGRNALILANAAYESFETGKSVRVDYK